MTREIVCPKHLKPVKPVVKPIDGKPKTVGYVGNCCNTLWETEDVIIRDIDFNPDTGTGRIRFVCRGIDSKPNENEEGK